MVIQLNDALKQMEARDERRRPVPFSVEFCTCDEERGTGGELIRLDNVVLARDRDSRPKRQTGATIPTPAKEASEWENATRNFYILDNEQIRKAHIRLITLFNNMEVVY